MFPKSNVSVHVHYENIFRTIEGSQLSDWRERKKNEHREAFNGNSGIQHQWQFKYSAQQQQHSPHIANTLNNQNKWVEKQIFILTQYLFRSFILQFVLRNHTHIQGVCEHVFSSCVAVVVVDVYFFVCLLWDVAFYVHMLVLLLLREFGVLFFMYSLSTSRFQCILVRDSWWVVLLYYSTK